MAAGAERASGAPRRRTFVRLGGRILTVIGVAIFVSAATFFLLRLARDPVDVVGAARGADISDPAARSALEAELGTDRPLVVQYLHWLGNAAQGDLGTSYLRPDQEVRETIGRALPVNLELVLVSQLIALLIGIPMGLAAGARAGARLDRLLSGAAAAFVSTPGFVVALGLITVFAVQLPWFPVTASGYVGFFEDPWTNLQQIALPSLSLAVPMIGVYARVLRSDVSVTLQEDFILMARSKGVPTRRVLFRHAFRPSSLSLIPLVALQCGALLGGSILVEQLFAFPVGLGSSLVTAAIAADIPVLLGVSTTIAVLFAVVTLVADAVARFADPRIDG